MIKLSNGTQMDITLEKDEGGNELVVILSGANQMKLTPQHARMLATKLVMTASRTDVRDESDHQGNFSFRPRVLRLAGQ